MRTVILDHGIILIMFNIKEISLNSILLLIGCIILPLIVGFIGSLFTIPSIQEWYITLNKPWFTPPNWLFGPAWTVLYILMGISLWLIIKDGLSAPGVRQSVYLFAAQLLVNLFWSVVFFGMHSPAGGLIVILVLIILIIATIMKFRFVSSLSAYLLVPYLCWTLFATVLTASVVILN